jgi:hypothetical protein
MNNNMADACEYKLNNKYGETRKKPAPLRPALKFVNGF